MRASIDMWKWFYDDRRAARAKNDTQRMQLGRYYDEGIIYRYDDPERALHSFTAGADFARKLGDPCWELFYNYWCCDIYVFSIRDLNIGLERSIQNFTLAHKPAYQNCAVIGNIYRILMDAFYRIDAEGYADQVRAMIAYMSENVRLDQDTVLILQRYRSGLHYTFDEWEDAEREGLHYLEASKGNYHREIDAYSLLVGIEIELKKHEEAYAYALELEKRAEHEKRKNSIAYALLVQALFKLRFNERDEAEQLYQRALSAVEDHKMPHSSNFYDTACVIQEVLGHPDIALKMRDEHLASVVDTRKYLIELDCRLQRCRLLGRLGKPIDEELAAAYAAVKKLRTPKLSLERLQKVEQGDYADPCWTFVKGKGG